MDILPPDSVLAILQRLWASGHAGYIVGGSLRDVLLERAPLDWDLASDARPERVQELFPGSVCENAFGTVAVRVGDDVHELTTFRSDHDYADFRRPHRVEFGDRIELDLARRDFTVNAMAWGADAPASGENPVARLADPHRGLADLETGTLRAVGDPLVRFEEDALRMIRAVRFATTLDFRIDISTFGAIRAKAPLIGHLSGERIAAELQKLLGAPLPSSGLRLLAATGLLGVLWPDLAAQQGVPQNKIPGDDLWDHTLRTVDAVPADRPVVRLAALLHDIGKPSTMADGHFLHHDTVGADLAQGFLERLHTPRATTEQIVHLVRVHMFTYDPTWGDAGIRRFIKRIGRDSLEPLFALREADNIGGGEPPDGHGLDELRRRVHEQLEGDVVLERGDLAIKGDDLIAELGVPQGPRLGRILEELLERAIADPAINNRPTLVLLAQSMLTDDA